MDLFTVFLLIGGILLAGYLLIITLRGALFLLSWASGSLGVIGFFLYVAAWFFFFPVMIVASLLVGFLAGPNTTY